MIQERDRVLGEARLEFANNGVLSLSTHCRLAELGFIVHELTDKWQAEELV
jgi:hypothetical protein